jgi:hypothetical protein
MGARYGPPRRSGQAARFGSGLPPEWLAPPESHGAPACETIDTLTGMPWMPLRRA